MEKDVVQTLQTQSTLKLIFLFMVTLGVYSAHYAKRQTYAINPYLGAEDTLSDGFVSALLVLAYASVLIIVPYAMVEEGHPVEGISSLLDLAYGLLFLYWAFWARARMNSLLSASKSDDRWFSGLWTFLFPGVYFNYKVNKLKKNPQPIDALT